MSARLSEREAAALGLVAKRSSRTTRKQATGPYRTRCVVDGVVFTRQVDEDRHFAAHPDHRRYDTVLT